MFICHTFYFMVAFEIANYADDSISFSTKLDRGSVVDRSEISSSILFNWLKNKYIGKYR